MGVPVLLVILFPLIPPSPGCEEKQVHQRRFVPGFKKLAENRMIVISQITFVKYSCICGKRYPHILYAKFELI